MLSRLFLAGPDSRAGPLESCPVYLYLGRNCQNQVQLLSKISKFDFWKSFDVAGTKDRRFCKWHYPKHFKRH